MKKMIAIKNIRVEETLYKPGEEFEIAEEETQRLIDLGAAEFVSSEIETADNEGTNSEEETNVGGLKEPEKENTAKKGKKNE
ncbi:hypothetical protein KST09_03265 [Fusobacterium animalis]|uniref:hypothetical protein n=1 Tax=Fusobacterium animalis TaxID=76859 RepID=UPI0030CC2237